MTHNTTPDSTQEIPYGYCQCGCGQKTRIATVTRRNKGWKRGEAIPFAPGHHLPQYAPPVERFWASVRKMTGDACWEWQSYRTPAGYGTFHVNGGPAYAHRFSYELHHGPIPHGMQVCHRCDNPACCNPDHLFLGTARDNHADMRAKERDAPPPHFIGAAHHAAKFTETDVVVIRQRYAGGESPTALAREYGVAQSTMQAMVQRKTWKHVP